MQRVRRLCRGLHEGAIAMVDGKARLMREDYCDGLGNCPPACPTDAISFEEREAAAYNEAAVQTNQAKMQTPKTAVPLPCGCPGTQSKTIQREAVPSALAADCTAYAYGDFHSRFMKNKVTLIGCPKLDEGDYAPKLTQILTENEIKSITVVRMEVP